MKGRRPYVPHVLKAILDLAEPYGSSVVSIINQVETLLPCRNPNDSEFPDEVYQSLMKARDDGLLLEEVRGKYKLDMKSPKNVKCLQSFIKKLTSPDDEVNNDNDEDVEDADNGNDSGNGDNGDEDDNCDGEEETQKPQESSKPSCLKRCPKPKKMRTQCVQKGCSQIIDPKNPKNCKPPTNKPPKYSDLIEDDDTTYGYSEDEYENTDECSASCNNSLDRKKKKSKCQYCITPTKYKHEKKLRCPFCFKSGPETEFKKVSSSDNVCALVNMKRRERELKEARKVQCCQKRLEKKKRKRAGTPYEEYRPANVFSFSKCLLHRDSEESSVTSRPSSRSFSQTAGRDKITSMVHAKKRYKNRASHSTPPTNSSKKLWW